MIDFAWESLEARAGIEPAHKGFADLSLTTWVPRLGPGLGPVSSHFAVHLVDCCRGGAEWSGRRDLNSRPSPWQGDALPLSYSRLTQIRVYRAAETGSNRQLPPRNGFCPPKLEAFCALRCILRRLTHLPNSRRLKDCEGCGSKGLPPRIIPEDHSLKFRLWRLKQNHGKSRICAQARTPDRNPHRS